MKWWRESPGLLKQIERATAKDYEDVSTEELEKFLKDLQVKAEVKECYIEEPCDKCKERTTHLVKYEQIDAEGMRGYRVRSIVCGVCGDKFDIFKSISNSSMDELGSKIYNDRSQ